MPSDELLARFQSILAHDDRLVTDADDLAPHLTDWRGRKEGAARAMLQPASTASLQAIVRLAVETRTPLVPQGGNTGLVGGSVPERDGSAILINLARMNRIRQIDTAGDIATVEAGVILQVLQDAAAAENRMFPLSLGAKGSATVGGLISTNAGGTQVLRYGTMRAQVLGMEAVLPDGTILNQLTPLRKDNSGYDIKQLLIGAEGTLGFITAASLRLVPAPKEVVTAFIGLKSPDAALSLMNRLKQATGDQIDSFELIPRDAIDLSLRHIAGARDPLSDRQPWYVLAEAASSAEGDILHDALETALADELEAGRIADAAIAQSETQRGEFWHLRETIAEAERADGLSLKHDIAVPVSDMPRFMAEVTGVIERRWPGMKVFAFGHLGDGNIHFNVRSDDRLPRTDLMALHDDVARLTYDEVTRFGGSISAEHGIGTWKAHELARLGDPGKLAAMRAVKAALDPHGLMNPGKVFAI